MRMIHFFRLPNLLLIAAFMLLFRMFYLAEAFDHHGFSFVLDKRDFALLVLDVIAVSLVGYWWNDWYDRSIDRINKPHRLLASTVVSRRQFTALLSAPLVTALVLTTWLAIEHQRLASWILLPASVFGLWAYAAFLKRYKLIGNVLVSALIASLPWLVLWSEWPVLMDLWERHPSVRSEMFARVTHFSALMFLANWAREMVKDLEDRRGDDRHGVHSLVTWVGEQYARWIASSMILCIAAIEVAFMWPTSAGITDDVLFAMVVFLSFESIRRCAISKSSARYKLASNALKWLMVVGLMQLIFTH